MECERYAEDTLTGMFGDDTDFRMDRRHLARLIATAYQQGRLAGADQMAPLASEAFLALSEIHLLAIAIRHDSRADRIKTIAARFAEALRGF